MKIALITTTINVPRVLELYRKLAGPEIKFFVALDKKSADLKNWIIELMERGAGDSNTIIFEPAAQEQYEHSELIGWNTDSRRNIALLEALKWGADLIVSVDDDMIPCQSEFVPADIFEFGFSGLMLGAPKQWFNAGAFTEPKAPQRGLPVPFPTQQMLLGSVVEAQVGAWQGIILGVPDTDACTAIAKQPFIDSASDILRNGFVVHPEAYVVFNSQFTAFRRELAPAFAQFYNYQGRNTDIFASVLMRRIMAERNLYTYFGPPMAFHARTPRPLFNDLKAEMWGLEHIAEYADYLRRSPLLDAPVVDQCRLLTEGCNLFSGEAKECAMAWYNDVEKVI
jgi:hypothetical protein